MDVDGHYWCTQAVHGEFYELCKLAKEKKKKKKSFLAAVAHARRERRSFPSQTGGTETHLGSEPPPLPTQWIKQELSWGMQRWELDWLKASREMMCGEKWLGERDGEKGGADGAVDEGEEHIQDGQRERERSKQERVIEGGETRRQDGKEWNKQES